MQRINYPQPKEWDEILKRPTQTVADIEEVVNSIFREVQSDGDTVIKKYTAQFDKIDLDSLVVSNSEIQKANDSVSDALKQAINLAKSNIEKFHAAQKTTKVEVETMPGVACWQEKRPIQKVGLYIPGGTA
ncbi:MAG TPA: histidinol dehydrogenase, partial [Allomuricauda sp.]|nr:histidinol dehydrogenase [Allomuricauda sp.]